jgi:hypothetical protein
MLSGRLSHSPLQALIPRLNWDRINNRLLARRGSRLVAVMNGGTIPDRNSTNQQPAGSRKPICRPLAESRFWKRRHQTGAVAVGSVKAVEAQPAVVRVEVEISSRTNH